ncbi:Ribose import permease protein RbsC [Paraburkholderia ultramafica]|uniref:Ribose import permease protein RbsC n=1 Tax=Paraburkholderia ultramafica TaxID=1544867 RepID=A0A6S7CFX4_9BURK|nr:ABC transporter permease [Paraburkholderia ultramafica]CAB3779172.1 Ribose import permease protein RbsC [Paraburkholderia ultramafica]
MTTFSTRLGGAKSGSAVQKFRRVVSENTVIFVFIAMLIIAGFVSNNFYDYSNILNILSQVSYLGVISCGMLLVIMIGGIDLSVGSMVALSSVVIAVCLEKYGFGLLTSLALGIAATCLAGFVSGLLVAKANIAAFVATLAMMTIVRGLALTVSGGRPIMIDNDFIANFAQSSVFGVPLPILVMLVFAFVTWFILQKTIVGRILIATGSNETSVVYSGIQVWFFKVFAYVFSGFACGISAVVLASRTGVGSPILGEGLELDAIAAVVIGGASLQGGRGRVLNTIVGVLILGVISNIMNLAGIPDYFQRIVKGLIIVAAVLTEGLRTRNRH